VGFQKGPPRRILNNRGRVAFLLKQKAGDGRRGDWTTVGNRRERGRVVKRGRVEQWYLSSRGSQAKTKQKTQKTESRGNGRAEHRSLLQRG